MKSALRLVGLCLLLGGFSCMPFPATNPEATTSIFPWLAMSGEVASIGAWAMGVGAAILTLSFVVRGGD